MADKTYQQKLFPYSGSEDVTRNPLLISPTDIVDSNNIIYTTYSTKKKRPGLTYAFDTLSKLGRHILGTCDYWKLGQQRVLVWDGEFIWAINPATGGISNITGTNVLPLDQTVTFLKFYGVVIIFFGGDQTIPKYWDMSGEIQDLLDPTTYAGYTPSFGSVFFNRLAIPSLLYPGRIHLSKTNDPTDFTTGDATVVDCMISDGDPDGVTALFPEYYGSLYVAKRLSIFQVTPVYLDATTIAFKPVKITEGVGCISHNSVVAAENDVFFASARGFHSLVSTRKFAQYETNFMSLNIQPSYVKNVNFERSQYMQGTYDVLNNMILWTYPASSYNYPTEVRGYSLIADKWFKWESFNQTSINKYVSAASRKQYTMVGGADGSIGILDDTAKSDYGVRIPTYVQSGIICPNGSPDDEFEFVSIAPIFVPQTTGSFTVVMKIDGKVVNSETFSMVDDISGDELGVDFMLGESYLGGVPSVKIDNRRIDGHGMMYQLSITHEQSDDEEPCDFELLGILVNVDINNKKIGTRSA